MVGGEGVSFLNLEAMEAEARPSFARRASWSMPHHGQAGGLPALGAVAGGVVFGVAKSGEGFQDSGNFGEADAGEIASDDFGCGRGGCLG